MKKANIAICSCFLLLMLVGCKDTQASDIEYSYFYRQTLDDEVKMTLAYTLEEEEFEKERRRIEGTYHIVSEEKIENTDLYFTAVSERVIFVGFDEDRHSILYGYLANMGQKTSEDYYGMMMCYEEKM